MANDEDIIKEGYLEKKSLYFRVKRVRWMVLKGRLLISYKQKQRYEHPTEQIDLIFFNRIKLSRKTHIKLYSGDQSRILIAPTEEIATDWIDAITLSMNDAVTVIPNNEDEEYSQSDTFDTSHMNARIDGQLQFNSQSLTLSHTQSLNNNNINNSDQISDEIHNCMALHRLIKVLKIHKNGIEMNDNQALIGYINENKDEILTDYHHILMEHTHFQQIDLECDIDKCVVYLRNCRERERQLVAYETDMSVYIDILDSMHVSLIHSVDIGFRIIDKLEPIYNSENEKNNVCYDRQIDEIKSYLKNKRKRLIETKGRDRFQKNRFITIIGNGNGSEEKKEKERQCHFGESIDYWEHHRKRKYASLQQELLNNSIFSVEKICWNSAFKKSQILMKSSHIKSIQCKVDLLNEKYKIDDGAALDLGHAISVVLYTDYDTLSYHFRKTIHEYGIWSQLLSETVNAYGTSVENTKIKSFYHSVSWFIFSSFIDMFYCPMSTTSSLQNGLLFGLSDGLLLELSKYSDGNMRSKYTRYFNCSLFGCMAESIDEHLFMQPPAKYCYLYIKGIINLKHCENYSKYIEAMTMFDHCIAFNTNNHTKYCQLSDKYANMIQKLMQKLMPKYVMKSFRKWAQSKSIISVHLAVIQKLNLTVNQDIDLRNLIKFDVFAKTFRFCKEIHCYSIGIMSPHYISSLLSILTCVNKVKHSKLSRIYLHGITNISVCSTSIEYPKIKWVINKYSYDDQIGEYLLISVC